MDCMCHSPPLQAVAMFTELIRENFRNSKLKQCLLPPLGELLYLIASQVGTANCPVRYLSARQ